MVAPRISTDLSFRELVSIHRYSFFDFFRGCNGAQFRYLDGNGTTEWPFEAKTEDYRRLIRALSDTTRKKDSERLCHLYMQSLCGRVQVAEVHRRGLISDTFYHDLRKTHSAFEACAKNCL